MRDTASNPYKFYFLISLILFVPIGITLWYSTDIHPLWIYLVTLSLITFLFYGYDKYQAIGHKSRIPEAVLHLLVLAGGTAGAFAGQLVFRHKTKKLSFRMLFIIIAVLQAGLVLWWFLRTQT
ncbi:MAG: DUF1294 domain-containing protein [Anaerohalosphaeraceae bacterium]